MTDHVSKAQPATLALKPEDQNAEDRILPGKTFYVQVCDGNLDGSLDMSSHLQKTLSLEEAKQDAIATMDDYNSETWVYECRPVLKVLRGKMRVIQIKGK